MLKRIARATAAIAAALVPLAALTALATPASAGDCKHSGGGAVMLVAAHAEATNVQLGGPNSQPKCSTDTSWGG
ncbi:hypothetical protein ACFWXK_20760 [Streptomyces sp. NPDC059070]|uniref:hypothetical protein n=1 Tax=unclassified Streptomyces TaxID=2593676 RepID=UPI0034E1B12E